MSCTGHLDSEDFWTVKPELPVFTRVDCTADCPILARLLVDIFREIVAKLSGNPLMKCNRTACGRDLTHVSHYKIESRVYCVMCGRKITEGTDIKYEYVHAIRKDYGDELYRRRK